MKKNKANKYLLKRKYKVGLENRRGTNDNGEGGDNCGQCSSNMFKALYVYV